MIFFGNFFGINSKNVLKNYFSEKKSEECFVFIGKLFDFWGRGELIFFRGMFFSIFRKCNQNIFS